MKEPQPDTIKVKGVTFQYVDSNPNGFVEMAPQPQPFPNWKKEGYVIGSEFIPTEEMPGHIEVAPNVYQSREDYEANRRYDEATDNELQDELNKQL